MKTTTTFIPLTKLGIPRARGRIVRNGVITDEEVTIITDQLLDNDNRVRDAGVRIIQSIDLEKGLINVLTAFIVGHDKGEISATIRKPCKLNFKEGGPNAFFIEEYGFCDQRPDGEGFYNVIDSPMYRTKPIIREEDIKGKDFDNVSAKSSMILHRYIKEHTAIVLKDMDREYKKEVSAANTVLSDQTLQ